MGKGARYTIICTDTRSLECFLSILGVAWALWAVLSDRPHTYTWGVGTGYWWLVWAAVNGSTSLLTLAARCHWLRGWVFIGWSLFWLHAAFYAFWADYRSFAGWLFALVSGGSLFVVLHRAAVGLNRADEQSV